MVAQEIKSQKSPESQWVVIICVMIALTVDRRTLPKSNEQRKRWREDRQCEEMKTDGYEMGHVLQGDPYAYSIRTKAHFVD